MAAVQHTEELHILRLNSLCRVCGRRSKVAKMKSPVRLCKNLASELYHFHGIEVSGEANGTVYSNTLCLSCSTRLNKLKNSETPPQAEGLFKAAAKQLEKTKDVWIQFNSKVEVSDCSVCHTFAEQNKSGRPRKPLKRCRESEDQSIPGSSSEACDSSVSFDNFKPQISLTPQKETVKKRLQEYLYNRRNVAQSDANARNDKCLSTASISKTRDALADLKRYVLAKESLFHSDKAVDIVPPHTEVNSLRPLEQLQAPLTKKEEAYLTGLVRIKLKQSDDKQTVVSKTRAGQPIILKKIIKARICRKASSVAASPL